MACQPRVEVFPVLNPKAAGIDVHADWHWVAVPPGSAPPTRGSPGGPNELPAEVRKFGTCTDDLEAIADWLKACGVTTVAMESTGVYWIPLFELLERRAFTVLLVDPRQTRRMLNQCDRQVESCLKTFADKTGGVPLAAKPRRHGKQGHDPRFDARSLLYRFSGADLTMIEGIGENTALVILSEIGPDVSRFPTVKNFTSWLGLCPQHREPASATSPGGEPRADHNADRDDPYDETGRGILSARGEGQSRQRLIVMKPELRVPQEI